MGGGRGRPRAGVGGGEREEDTEKQQGAGGGGFQHLKPETNTGLTNKSHKFFFFSLKREPKRTQLNASALRIKQLAVHAVYH